MKIKIFNSILNNPNSSITVKSISALHIVKFHSLFVKKNFKFFLIIHKILKVLILNNIYYFYKTLKGNNTNTKKVSEKKVLIISHLINKKHLNSKQDFYYGNFENVLKKMNKSFFKIMINHTKYSSSYLNLKNKYKNSYILEKDLDFSSEVNIFTKKMLAIFELVSLLVNKKINFKIFLILTASLFDSSTSFSLRMYYQIKDYVKKIKPDYCILTYEGYTWERMCIKGIKTINPKIKCIGYQHTPVTNNHHAIFNYISGNFNPDKIWCSQNTSYRILRERVKSKKKDNVHLIGSFKKIIIKKLKNKKKDKFLVIPEGIYSECENLFKFTLNLAKKFKNFKFIWRVHPVIDFTKVLNNLNLNEKDVPKNIKISNDEFDHDVYKSTYVIYKGSAAVLKSVLMGNYPIYFKSNNEKNFDPLKDFFNKKNYFSNEKEFLLLLKKIQSKKYKKEIKNKVLSIKKNIFLKPNLQKIKKHLAK